jgi:hypothetical protein
MLRFYLFSVLCCFILSSNGQNIYHKAYVGFQGEAMGRGGGFVQTDDSGYLIGNFGTLMKLGSAGVQEWRYNWGAIPGQYIHILSIQRDYSNGYILSGYPVLISLDSSYNLNWIKEIINNNTLGIYCSQKSDSLSYIFVGEMFINNESVVCLIKTDISGNIIWAKRYYYQPMLGAVYSIAAASDGSVLACGSMRSSVNPAHYDCVVFRVDSGGSVLWAKRYAGIGNTTLVESIKATSDGHFVVTGGRSLKSYLMKIDLSGSVIWQKSYSTGLNARSIDVINTHDSGFAMACDGVDIDPIFGGLGQTSVLIKTDSLGNPEWAKYLGGFANVFASRIVQTNDLGFAVLGRRTSINGLSLNLIKTDSLGGTGGCLELHTVVTVMNLNDSAVNFILVDSSTTMTTIPYNATFPLIGNEIDLCNFQGLSDVTNHIGFDIYPNPFSSYLKVNCYGCKRDKLHYMFYNTMGRLIGEGVVLDNKINTENLSFGLYFIKIIEDNRVVFSGKLIKW